MSEFEKWYIKEFGDISMNTFFSIDDMKKTWNYQQERIEKLQAEVQSTEALRTDLALAREGLEYYGDTDNYTDVYYGNYGLINECDSETCGFKAREILAQLEQRSCDVRSTDKKDGE